MTQMSQIGRQRVDGARSARRRRRIERIPSHLLHLRMPSVNDRRGALTSSVAMSLWLHPFSCPFVFFVATLVFFYSVPLCVLCAKSRLRRLRPSSFGLLSTFEFRHSTFPSVSVSPRPWCNLCGATDISPLEEVFGRDDADVVGGDRERPRLDFFVLFQDVGRGAGCVVD